MAFSQKTVGHRFVRVLGQCLADFSLCLGFCFGSFGIFGIFGMVGIIIGPIIAALFVSIWEIYGEAFQDILPDTGYVLRKKQEEEGASEELAES